MQTAVPGSARQRERDSVVNQPLAGHGHSLALKAISHRYGDALALAEVNLDIRPGELIALLGPSGCGKTTLLRIIAGFLMPTTGQVLVDTQTINAIAASERNVGIVFQNYALFPHMTVLQNVSYGPRARGVGRQKYHERAQEMLRLVKMETFAGRYPGELSGGQQQRVALARAFAIEPKILLLDEPFSALDKNLRLDMQIEVKGLLKQYGITSILVTHDQEEALSMADRIVVLNQGQVEQTDIPTRIYDSPASLFVNRFVGHTNLVAGKVTGAAGRTCTVQLNCGPTLDLKAPNGLGTGANVLVSIRPENLRVAAAPGPYTIPATARLNLPLGPVDVLEAVTADGLGIKLTFPHQRQSEVIGPGAVVHLQIVDLEACSLFPDSTAVHH